MADDEKQKKKLEELEKLRAQSVANEPNWDTTSSAALDAIDLDKWQDGVGDNWTAGGGSPTTPQAGAPPTMNWSHTSSAASSLPRTGGAASSGAASTPQQQPSAPQGQGDNYEWAPPAGAAEADYAWLPPEAPGNDGGEPQDLRDKLSQTLTPSEALAIQESRGALPDFEGSADQAQLIPGLRAKKMQTPEEARKQAELDARRAGQKAEYDKAASLIQVGDSRAALRLLKELASDGSADAQYKLGVLYQKGQGISQDYARAAMWFEKAALQDHPKAQYNLGLMYKDGLGVEADHRRAIMWWELSAKQGHANSQFNLVAICKRYAEKGDAASMYKLGRMCFRGAGMEASKEAAYEWFVHSAKWEYPPAVYWVGLCSENGWGCEADMNRAVRAYDHAFRLGLVEAGAK